MDIPSPEAFSAEMAGVQPPAPPSGLGVQPPAPAPGQDGQGGQAARPPLLPPIPSWSLALAAGLALGAIAAKLWGGGGRRS